MKNRSLDLLDKALKQTGLPERALSRQLGLTSSSLAMCRMRGNLSPAIAATLAEHIGEDVAKWTLTAVAEAERGTSLKAKVARLAETINSYVSRFLQTVRPSRRNRKP